MDWCTSVFVQVLRLSGGVNFFRKDCASRICPRDGVHQCLAIDVNRNEAVHRAAYTDGNWTLLKLFDDLPDASHKGLPYQLWILFTVMREGLQGRVVELCRMQ